jgi:hypothetical protein
MAVRIDIVRLNENGQDVVRFVRSPAQVPANGQVFWCNLDNKERHHINLLQDALERFTSDPPGPDTSDHVVVTERIEYRCLLHAGETGTITVEGARRRSRSARPRARPSRPAKTRRSRPARTS